jgi:serine/threonine-protein kinase HipA
VFSRRLRCSASSARLCPVDAKFELFAALVERYAQYSGVSGIQPKVLVRDDGSVNFGSLGGSTKAARLTTQGTTHIVKAFDVRRYPGLAVNEHFCLRAARASGLNVVNAALSHDGQLLAIERFDLLSGGRYAAFEDGCSLTGRRSEDKYTGSYEQLAATFARAITGVTDPAKEMGRFFRSVVLSVAVRNGDAHRKNFGVLYNDPTIAVALAPIFDIVTTTPYRRQDTLALTIDGSKRWPAAKRLEKFGVSRCGLRPEEAKLAIAQVVEGVSEISKEMALPASQALDPGAQEVLAVMRQQWSEGVASLTSRKTIVASPQPAALPSSEPALTPLDIQPPQVDDSALPGEPPKPRGL